MAIPKEVVDWFRNIFSEVNRRVSEKIYNVPAIHESHLDTSFIEHLLGFGAPRAFSSGWSVRIDTHYIVTEYGAANLKGRSSSERATALIGLAHPQFRDELSRAAKALHLI